VFADWALLYRAIGHAAKSIVLSRLAKDLGILRSTLYDPRAQKSIPVQSILQALMPDSVDRKSIHLPKIVKITSHDDCSIVLTYDDGVVGKLDMTSYLDTGVFVELKDLAYFHRVENRGSFIEWPHGQDLCADSIYASMIRLHQDRIEYVSDCEQADIEGDSSLSQSLKRGSRDAFAGRGNFMYSPSDVYQFDEYELDTLDAVHLKNIIKECRTTVQLDSGFSEILINTIGELSEKEYCAGWRAEIEFEVWDQIHSSNKTKALLSITPAQRLHFKLLSQLAGGWIHYGDQGKKLVPLAEWRSLFAIWKSNRAQ
jgi:hypothetical protein